jgi:hypothetical protein
MIETITEDLSRSTWASELLEMCKIKNEEILKYQSKFGYRERLNTSFVYESNLQFYHMIDTCFYSIDILVDNLIWLLNMIYIPIKMILYPIRYIFKKIKNRIYRKKINTIEIKNIKLRQKYDINIAIQKRMKEEENSPKFEIISENNHNDDDDDISLSKYRYSRSKEGLKIITNFSILHMYSPLMRILKFIHKRYLSSSDNEYFDENSRNVNENKNIFYFCFPLFKFLYSVISSCTYFLRCKKRSQIYDVDNNENEAENKGNGTTEDVLGMYVYICV